MKNIIEKIVYDAEYEKQSKIISKKTCPLLGNIDCEGFYSLIDNTVKKNIPHIQVKKPIFEKDFLIGYPTILTYAKEKNINLLEILELIPHNIRNTYFNKFEDFKNIEIYSNINTSIIKFKFIYCE